MKNFISAGEAIRESANPFIAMLDSGELASTAAIELSVFHDKINNLTLVTNQKQTYSPQSGEPMTAIPNTTTSMDAATRAELADTCTLMQCAACKRRAMVENELSFTIANEEMACPACGQDTQFVYVDDGDDETASLTTLSEIQAHTFTGNEDTDAEAYNAIESFIMSDASMPDKIAALGVMMRSMGVDETPTEEDVNDFISEAKSFAEGGDDDAGEEYDGDSEFASFAPRYLSRKYELADTVSAELEEDTDTLEDDLNNITDEDSMDADGIDPVTGETTPITPTAAPTDVAPAVVDPAAAAVTDPAAATAPTPVVKVEEPTPAADATMETITDADLVAAPAATDVIDVTGEDTVDNDSTVELDDALDATHAEDAFGLESFADDDVTTVTMASLVDRTQALTFAPLSRDGSEVAVFVGASHVGTLSRRASAETASTLFDSNRITQAFTAAFHAHRDTFETATELRAYGFRPVQFRVRLGEVAAARIEAARTSAASEVAQRVSRAVARHGKLLNLALLGVAKDHFKIKATLIPELAAVLERSGVLNAQNTIRRAFAQNGPAFFAAVVEKANDLSTKSDDHLNGISESIADKEFVGGQTTDSTTATPNVPVAPADGTTGETAGFGGQRGLNNSSPGKNDFGHLVRSISRRR